MSSNDEASRRPFRSALSSIRRPTAPTSRRPQNARKCGRPPAPGRRRGTARRSRLLPPRRRSRPAGTLRWALRLRSAAEARLTRQTKEKDFVMGLLLLVFPFTDRQRTETVAAAGARSSGQGPCALGPGERTAVVEAAARRKISRGRHLPGNGLTAAAAITAQLPPEPQSRAAGQRKECRGVGLLNDLPLCT